MKNVFLVLGEEKKDAEEKISSLLSSFSVDKPDVRFGFDPEDVSRTVSDIETPPLFGDRFFIVIENSEQLIEKNASALAKSIQSNDFDGVVVFRSEQNKVSSHIENIVSSENRFVFYTMFESKKPQFVRSVFKKNGYFIEDDAVIELLNLVDNDKSTIESSCKRVMDSLSVVSGDRKTVLQSDVSDFLDFDKDEDSIELFSHVANKRLKQALMSAERAARSQRSLVPVVLSLLGYVRKATSYMMNIRSAASDPWRVSTISGDMTVRYPAEKDFLKAFASNYGFEASLRAEYLLLKLESVTRSGMDLDMQMIRLGEDLTRIIAL